jgi:hypothetical protein
MEQYYQGKWDPAMMGDYCWFHQRDDIDHKRNTKRDISGKTKLFFICAILFLAYFFSVYTVYLKLFFICAVLFLVYLFNVHR